VSRSARASDEHLVAMHESSDSGKTMLARRVPTILSPLEPDEAFEITRIHSATGHTSRHGLAHRRPSARRITRRRPPRSSGRLAPAESR
jgi:predicted ATPase with chaperone activity